MNDRAHPDSHAARHGFEYLGTLDGHDFYRRSPLLDQPVIEIVYGEGEMEFSTVDCFEGLGHEDIPEHVLAHGRALYELLR